MHVSCGIADIFKDDNIYSATANILMVNEQITHCIRKIKLL